jgi:hypothetical protein
MRSLEDLIDCQEDSNKNSYFQEGNGMRLAEDLINWVGEVNFELGGQWEDQSGLNTARGQW